LSPHWELWGYWFGLGTPTWHSHR